MLAIIASTPTNSWIRCRLAWSRKCTSPGGVTVEKSYLQRPVLADSHSHPVPDGALDLLDHTLARQSPDAIILERDDRLDAVDEIMDDVRRIRARLARRHLGGACEWFRSCWTGKLACSSI